MDAPWAKSVSETLAAIKSRAETGLSQAEASRRLKQIGENLLHETKRKSVWRIILDQFKELMILLLFAAAFLSFIFGEWIQGFAIIAAIIINAVIGFFTEFSAIKSISKLTEMGETASTLLRDGKKTSISAEKLVPGDIILLESGDVVSADLRVIESDRLQADESALTGESVPVDKQTEPLPGDTDLAERTNLLHKGTVITRGNGKAVVVSTGMATEIGRISKMASESEGERTPLEKRLNKLANSLIWITIGISVLVGIIGTLAHDDLFLIIETAIALAIAAIPEGLPIVATVALAQGMWHMAQRNALTKHLAAVETLGSTTIICTDKTGTLTENRMTLVNILFTDHTLHVTGEGLSPEGVFCRDKQTVDIGSHSRLDTMLRIGVLCNTALLPDNLETQQPFKGEPLEIALLVAAKKAGINEESLRQNYPEIRAVPFESNTKMMATFHQTDQGIDVAVKGAPEAVFTACDTIETENGVTPITDELKKLITDKSNDLAQQGLRLLAFARKTVSSESAAPYSDLTFVAVAGFLDPPRHEVKDAIIECKQAGIRIVMVTGDRADTAAYIGREVGLIENHGEEKVVKGSALDTDNGKRRGLFEASIFYRVTPEQKMKLITFYQHHGMVVAMTGDGINDAPALKKADIGIAMGKRGTQVAKDVADMVLLDDRFATIVTAVRYGRIIFNNIRKFILYLLPCHVGEIIAVTSAFALNTPLPVLPLQILFLNIVTDVFPALSVGVGKGDNRVMTDTPRKPDEPVLKPGHWLFIVTYGILIAIPVMINLSLALYWLDLNETTAVSISFLTLGLASILHVFNVRDRKSAILNNDIVKNKLVWGSLLLCTGLLALCIYTPGLNTILRLTDPGLTGWLLATTGALLTLTLGQLIRELM